MVDFTNDFLEDDSVEINLRAVSEVVRRAVALITVARRGAIEEASSGVPTEEAYAAESDRFELYSWARQVLADAITDSELTMLLAETGSLDGDDIEYCAEALISAEALCWSVGITVDLPAPAFPSDSTIDAMFKWSPGPWQELDRLAAGATFRNELAIAQERERRELWHWRSSLDPDDFKSPETLALAILDTAHEAHDAGLILLSGDDFSLHGEPFATLASQQIDRIGAIAELQVVALNWVCGYGDSWESAPLYLD